MLARSIETSPASPLGPAGVSPASLAATAASGSTAVTSIDGGGVQVRLAADLGAGDGAGEAGDRDAGIARGKVGAEVDRRLETPPTGEAKANAISAGMRLSLFSVAAPKTKGSDVSRGGGDAPLESRFGAGEGRAHLRVEARLVSPVSR